LNINRRRTLPVATTFSSDHHALLDQIRQLGLKVRQDGARRMSAWGPLIERQNFLPAAENLAHYLSLRSRDLSGLQTELSERGLSSLGRCEAQVLPTLDAVTEALARICSAKGSGFPAAGWKRARDVPLQEQLEAIFGRDPSGPRGRIMVTLGRDAAEDPKIIHHMIEAGADCVRINCAHDDTETWAMMIKNTRTAAQKLGRDCRVLMDLAGPKVRIASVETSAKRVHMGDQLILVKSGETPREGGTPVITSSEIEPLRLLEKGHRVLIDDGKIGCVVEARTGGVIRLRVDSIRPKGVKLKPGKGLNFPDLNLTIPPLTQKDLADLDFVSKHADVIGYSFVQRADDIKLLQGELAKRLGDRPLPPLVIKVETRLGVANLPDLIVTAAARQPTAVMIARGDLAVELGLQQMSETQEELLWLCEAAHVPVVWATQVLDNLLKTGIPSRAEATDAAMAQRAECVMLNKGSHVVEAVRFLDNILHRMDKHTLKKSAVLGALAQWSAPAKAVAAKKAANGASQRKRTRSMRSVA
jgi:pyruvate kinase